MKKMLIKSISFMLVIIMTATTLFSCISKPGYDETDAGTEPSTESNAATESSTSGSSNGSGSSSSEGNNVDVDTSKFPDNAFPIFDGSAYTIKVVVSDNASATERQVATTLRSELKKKTKATISQSTDFLKTSESYNSEAYEILVGLTKHEESVAVYRTLDYDNYGIKTIGNKIVFHFATIDEGTELVETFINALQKNDNKAFWIDDSIQVSQISSPVLTGLPTYPDSYSTKDTGDNTKMIVSTSTTLANFNSYCTELKKAGYEEYSKRENIDGNYFRTYTKGSTAVTAYFSNGRKDARIIVGPINHIPSKEVDETPETFKPSLTMISPGTSCDITLSLVYQLENGKFIIVDGGYVQADRLYKELRQIQPNATKYVIAGWFLTHPHDDHQDALENLLDQHAHEVEIENFYYNYAPADYYNSYTSSDHQDLPGEGPRVERLRELLEKKLSRKTNIVKAHTGHIFTFGSATVEIISTVEDLLPTKLPHVNESSMVIRITVAGQSTMVLADASEEMKGIIRSMYDSHVKSDIVTMAHHGVWDTTPELYSEIGAKTLLWPSTKDTAKTWYNKTNSFGQAVKKAVSVAKDVFFAHDTDVVLNLPYTPVGNKSSYGFLN